VLVVTLGYLIWYRVALGCRICQKIKSSPVGGGVVVVWFGFYLIWYRVALGWLICRKIKSSPVGGGAVVVVVL
jgi:hypothetical protein